MSDLQRAKAYLHKAEEDLDEARILLEAYLRENGFTT